jgi:hypothetical protein
VTDYAIYIVDPSGIITNWNTGAARLATRARPACFRSVMCTQASGQPVELEIKFKLATGHGRSGADST